MVLFNMDSVCRTCLSSTALWPLFPVAAQQRSFARALYLSTGLQIEVDDGLPQKICQICANTIEDAMRFRLQSQAAEKQLQLLFHDNLYVHADMNSSSSICMDTIILEEDEISQGIEEICNAEDIIQNEQRERNMHLTRRSDWYVNRNNISREIKLEKEKELEKLIGTENGKYCKFCNKEFTSTKYLRKHIMWKHLSPKILCEFCGKICKETTDLLLHQRTKHGVARDKAFLCSFCDFIGLYQQHLEEHIRGTHTKERPFACGECDARFFTRPVLRQHMAVHTTDRPYTCKICFKKCKRRGELTSHINRTHTKKYIKKYCKTKKYKYGCYLCPKIYETIFGARQHIEKIHGLPFKNQSKLIRYDREPKKEEECVIKPVSVKVA